MSKFVHENCLVDYYLQLLYVTPNLQPIDQNVIQAVKMENFTLEKPNPH